MDKKMTRRLALGTIIGGLAISPFVIRAFRGGGVVNTGFMKARKEYLDSLSFPREYKPGQNPYIAPDDNDLVVQIQKRYWSNYAKLRKVEFDYSSQSYAPGGIKTNYFWDMDVHVKMEYGQGFTIKGKDSTGHSVDIECTQAGTIWREARINAGVASLMRSFFGADMAFPEMCSFYSEIREGVELMPNPYIKGNGLYDLLVLHDPPTKRNMPRSEQSVAKLDYYNRDNGMLELRYIHFAPGVSYGRGTAEGAVDTEAETFWICEYEPIGSIYLTTTTAILCPQTKFRSEARYSGFLNVEFWPDI